MDYSEKWGVDVEEAVKLALIDLKLSRDEVEVIVLEKPSKGFFGIGSKLAKVRVEKKKLAVKEIMTEPEKNEKLEQKKYKNVKETILNDFDKKVRMEKNLCNKGNINKRNHNENREKREKFTIMNLDIDPVDRKDLHDIENHEALTFLKKITEKMGLVLDFHVKAGENIVYLKMNGKDSGTIIGKRGRTLDAIQYLTNLVVNKDSEKYIKIVIDAEDYRAKRQKTLEQLANRLAAKVVNTKKYVRLEPMNPYERKIIHATLQKNPNIVTKSEGKEPYRRVIIELKK